MSYSNHLGQTLPAPATVESRPLPGWVIPAVVVVGAGFVWLSITSFTRDLRRLTESAEGLSFFADRLRRNKRRRARR